MDERRCGVVEECEVGTRFVYDAEYLACCGAVPVSLTLPLREEALGCLPFPEICRPDGMRRPASRPKSPHPASCSIS
ncbi:MAG TPA: hypothetical protein ENJ09_00210 [Planctomycetes bacterium]|nr:hypothetical protein [Planctomycetota bacterium]